MTAHVYHDVSGCFGCCQVFTGVRCLSSTCWCVHLKSAVFCNATLYSMTAGNIHRLEVVMNSAAQLITDTGTYHLHYTCSLRHFTLAAGPIVDHVKISVLAFSCIRDTGPAKVNDVCTPLADIPARSSLSW